MGRKSKWPVGITERQLKDGTTRFQLAFSFRGVPIRKLTQHEVSAANAKYLSRLRATIYLEIEQGTFTFGKYWPGSREALLYDRVSMKDKTLEIALREMIAEMRETLPVEPGTIDGYASICENNLIPSFGHLRLVDLDAHHIERWVRAMDVRKATVIAYLQPLRRLIKGALRRREIEYDPTSNLDYTQLLSKKQRKAKREDENIDPFNLTEITQILDAAYPWSRNAIQFNFFMGLRISELVSLRWEHIDFDRRLATIAESKDTMGRTKGTKTDTVRVMEIRGPALEALLAQRSVGGSHVLVNRYGEPFTNWRRFRDHWIKTLAKTKVRYRSPYQMRHTFASMMLQRGENVLWVANMMGHKNFTMLEQHYAKWIPRPDDGFETANDWSAVLFSEQNRTEIAHTVDSLGRSLIKTVG